MRDSDAAPWRALQAIVGDDPDAEAMAAVQRALGTSDGVETRRGGSALACDDGTIHPYLFDCSDEARIVDGALSAEWVPASDILQNRETEATLWRAYQSVAPTLSSLRDDREHGAAYLSVEALETLRDRAAEIAATGEEQNVGWRSLRDLALELCNARPSMIVVENRVDRVMHAAAATRSLVDIERAAQQTIQESYERDVAASRRASDLVAGRVVSTFSRSKSALDALTMAEPRPREVVVAESRPGREGVAVAEHLERSGVPVVLVPDAAISSALGAHSVELSIVGADAILPSGAIVNKTGTRLLALASRDREIPFYVVASEDKISTREEVDLSEIAQGTGIGDSRPASCPLFEITPAPLISGFIVSNTRYVPEEILSRAERLLGWKSWRDSPKGEHRPGVAKAR